MVDTPVSKHKIDNKLGNIVKSFEVSYDLLFYWAETKRKNFVVSFGDGLILDDDIVLKRGSTDNSLIFKSYTYFYEAILSMKNNKNTNSTATFTIYENGFGFNLHSSIFRFICDSVSIFESQLSTNWVKSLHVSDELKKILSVLSRGASKKDNYEYIYVKKFEKKMRLFSRSEFILTYIDIPYYFKLYEEIDSHLQETNREGNLYWFHSKSELLRLPKEHLRAPYKLNSKTYDTIKPLISQFKDAETLELESLNSIKKIVQSLVKQKMKFAKFILRNNGLTIVSDEFSYQISEHPAQESETHVKLNLNFLKDMLMNHKKTKEGTSKYLMSKLTISITEKYIKHSYLARDFTINQIYVNPEFSQN